MRQSAVDALGALGEHALEHFEAIVALLAEHADADVRQAANKALFGICDVGGFRRAREEARRFPSGSAGR